MTDFKQRAEKVGAIINAENNEPTTQYDFLGEHYNHETKERSLTQSTVLKIAFILDLLNDDDHALKVTARRIFAIVGTLMYAADVLDIDLSAYVTAMKLYIDTAREASTRGSYDIKVKITPHTLQQFIQWARLAHTNRPVHVIHGSKRPTQITTTAYVDASVWGWGCIVLKDGKTRAFAGPWAQSDHDVAAQQGGYLASSVYAEPLAIRKAVCCIENPGPHVLIYSDHEPMVHIRQKKRFSCVASYNDTLHTLLQLGGVQLAFIPGLQNPADALSRGRPPLLPVTHVGSAEKVQERRRGDAVGVGRGCDPRLSSAL
jgi:hypothetical protein